MSFLACAVGVWSSETSSFAPSAEITPRSRLRVVYLRSTPGPGTQAGGAASHIKGVVEGLEALGVEVQIISNDLIAGLDVSEARFTVIPPQPGGGGTRALFEIHNNLVFTRAAVPLIERADPDFIYQRYARFSWAGVVASNRTKRPLFLEGESGRFLRTTTLAERWDELRDNAAEIGMFGYEPLFWSNHFARV